jgi:hypothetical protein
MKNKFLIIGLAFVLFACGAINAQTTSTQTTTGSSESSAQNVSVENVKTIEPQTTSVQKINTIEPQKAVEPIIKTLTPIIKPVENLLQTNKMIEQQKVESKTRENINTSTGAGGGAVPSVSSPTTTIVSKCEYINQERTKELDNLLVELKKATLEGQNELVVRIKEKIAAINLEIEKAKKECSGQTTTQYPQSTTSTQLAPTLQKPTTVENPSEIAVYYKEKMTNILQKTSDTDTTIDSLKQLRDEIDQMIVRLIKEKEKIKMSDIKDLTQEMTITPSQIQVNNVKVNIDKQKEISIESKGKEINIKADLQNVQIEDGAFNVKSSEQMKVKNDGISIAEQNVSVLPTEATSLFKLKPEEVKEFNLSVENNKPVYNIKTVEERKLLGVIPVSITREAKIDATSSEKNILEDNKPWWTFLTSK